MPSINYRNNRAIGIVGVPFSKGQRKPGTENGPTYLREGGLVDRLIDMGCKVHDHGDVEFEDVPNDTEYKGVKNPRNVAAGTLKIAESVEKAVSQTGRCLAIGGDHSMAIGTILGHARVNPDLCVLWVDAHADINTPLTSESGNIHGMPLSFLVKELAPFVPKLPGWEDIEPCISVKNIAWIGLRDVDKGEKKIIDKFGMTAFSMQEVDKYGIKEVFEKAMKAIDPEGNRPIHLSFDVDSMDPAFIPSTGTPVVGGLSVRETFYIAEEASNTGRLAHVDVAEVNPCIGHEMDVANTVKMTLDVVERFYGNPRQGSYPTDFEIPLPTSQEDMLIEECR